MKLPYGTGLAASLEQVPTKFSLDWRILGSEFTGLSLAGDVDVIAGPGPDPAIAPARVSVRMGTPVVPSGWPNGEPEAAVELADLKATSPLGLISLSELRRARLSIGSSTWDKRDVEMGLVRVDALFVQSKTTLDRRLRFGYTSASGQDLFKNRRHRTLRFFTCELRRGSPRCWPALQPELTDALRPCWSVHEGNR